MTIEDNKQVVRRFVDEVFVAGRVDAVDELLAPAFTPHTWPSVEPGRDSFKAAMRRMAESLSEVSMTIDDLIAERDRVAVRLTSHAVHSGDSWVCPPPGSGTRSPRSTSSGSPTGRSRSIGHVADQLGLMRQLGALPRAGGG
jgi:predicted SnoaL-like aldol condensation-catalyzing enzyme